MIINHKEDMNQSREGTPLTRAPPEKLDKKYEMSDCGKEKEREILHIVRAISVLVYYTIISLAAEVDCVSETTSFMEL